MIGFLRRLFVRPAPVLSDAQPRDARTIAALHAASRRLQKRQLHEARVAVLRAISLDDARDGDGEACRSQQVADLEMPTIRKCAAHERAIAAREEIAHRACDELEPRRERLLSVRRAHAAEHDHIEARAAVRHDDLHGYGALHAGNAQ